MSRVYVPTHYRKKKTPISHGKRSKKETAFWIEKLGCLNDEWLRLVALPILDTDGMLSLADEYKIIGMSARSKQIRKEAGRMNGTSRFAVLCELLQVASSDREALEDMFWWWAENQPEKNSECLERCIELARDKKPMPWEETAQTG